jgi:hypothetical protein
MLSKFDERPLSLEPKLSCRFSIEIPNVKVPSWCFQSFKIYTEGEDLFFETSLIDFVTSNINPIELLNSKEVYIHFLDPTGAVVNKYYFKIKAIYYELNGDYGKDELLTHKLKMKISEQTFKYL